MKPLVHIGWILAVDTRSDQILSANQGACRRLHAVLEEQFPQFEWRVEFRQRHRYAPRGALDPLPLLEFGVREKTLRHWDYALVVVTNALHPRQRVETIGIPSSALETAVLASAELGRDRELEERLVALALHLLGHIWGLEHEESGPMHPPEDPVSLKVELFLEAEQAIIIDRLEEVADRRLEEQQKRWRLVSFYWRAFWADPKSILIDIIGYAPWSLPFQMGRLTATTAVSLVILLLTAESWDVGVNLPFGGLAGGGALIILASSWFLFYGQHLGQISRDVGWREQLARTRIVIFGTLILGMAALWIVLFIFSLVAGSLFPVSVLSAWTRMPDVTTNMLVRQAAFLADLGVLAGAFGGNLEDENVIKAQLLYDEET